MMRILYSHRIQSRDGMSVHIDAIVSALREAGHEVLVVGPGVYEEAEFGGESRLVARLRSSLPRPIAELAELAYNIPAYRRLARAADTFAPDLLYERYNLFFLAGTILARRRKLPFFVEANSPLADERLRFGGLSLVWLARWLERINWRAADKLLAVTGVLRDRLIEQGAPADRVEVVPNGIEPEAYAALPPRPDAPDPVVLGFVGFVRDWHGLDAVIDAMAAYPGPARVALTVVGEGPARPALEAQAARLGLSDRVRFTGLAARDAIPGLVSGFDIALQPKVTEYASPLKVFEYMAAGRAIVAPDQPNIREILTNGETALLFDPSQPGAVWDAVRRLIEDPTLRARIGAAARAEIARRDFTWAANVRRLIGRAEALRSAAPRP
jgi:glycosyltransferase involved in cell wall biosynthesis